MAILVIAEHNNAALAAATLNTVAAAKAIGGDIHVLVAGQNVAAVAEAAAKVEGVSKVLVADNAAYAHQLPENVAPLIAELGKNYSHVLAPATTNGKNFLPRVAALLDVDQISEIVEVVSPDTFKRPIYAGNAIATVQSSAAVKVITVRTTGFDAVAAEGGSAAVEQVSGPAEAGKSAFVGGRPDRQDRRPAAVHRGGHLRCHPAPGGHEGLEGDRRDQQGRRGSDLPGRRLRPGRRPVRRRTGAGKGRLSPIPSRQDPLPGAGFFMSGLRRVTLWSRFLPSVRPSGGVSFTMRDVSSS